MPGGQVLQPDRPELRDRMLGKPPVVGDRAGATVRQSLGEPILDAKSHCVPRRRLDPGVEFTVDDLEFVLNFGLGTPSHLAPDAALAIGGVAQGDRPCPVVVGRVEVDRVFAVTAPPARGSHGQMLTVWLLLWLLLRRCVAPTGL